MKLFIVAVHMAKKRKISILLLMMEVILSAVVMVSLIGQMLFLQKSALIVKTFNGSDCYYFSPRSYYDPDFRIENYLSDEERDCVDLGTTHILSVKTDQNRSVKVIGYSDFIIERARLKIEAGGWFTDVDCNTVPLIAIGDTYQIGKHVTFSNGCEGTVIGTIDKEAYVISFMSSGSSGNASLSNFISIPTEINFIAPYESEQYLSLPAEVIGNDTSDYSQIVSISDAGMESRIVNKLGRYGDVSSIEEMSDNYGRENRDYFMVNGMIFFIFMILTGVGISGINGISSVENEYVYTVMYILGLDTKKCMVIEAMNTFMVVGISYLIFLLGYKWLVQSVLPVGVENETVWILAVTFLYFLALYVMTSVSAIRKAGKCNVMELYKRKE